MEEVGAGVALEASDLGRLPDAVRAVLAERTYRERAGAIARETRRLPTVGTATEILRGLARAA